MEKMRMESFDQTQSNVDKIAELFPNCITETVDENGKLKRAINFELLRQMLSGDVLEGDEAYEFTWVGKKATIVEANKPIRKTLRPCPYESVNWDTTENLYIEGDNLEVLKLLQESYLGKVKMIYIDPPYNTGNDFIYADDFMRSQEEENAQMGMYDEDENRLFKNTDTNGRFHSDWCSMIYPRLMLARNLLTDDGLFFVSIDDNEEQNIRKLCDEVFGESNFIACIVWQKIHSIKNDAKYFSENHEYALVYAKSIDSIKLNLLPRTEEMNSRYKNPDGDPRGSWQSGDLVASGERSNGHFLVTSPKTGKTFDVPQGKHWVYSQENLLAMVADNRIWFGEDGNSFPRKKRFLTEVQDGRTPNTLWLSDEVGHNQAAAREVKALFDDKKFFDFPKPVNYIKQMLQIAADSNSIILDFFSGSATTAHAVMQLNAEDGGHRKFIMVQLPEKCDEQSEAYKAGYKTICEIGKERIRRAAKKIAEENPAVAFDGGFRVFKLDDSNMNDVYYSAGEYHQDMLSFLESNVKSDRNDLDLLFGCLLEWGLPLSMPYTSEQIEGCTVHTYNDGDLIACFDENIPDSVIKEIAKRRPLRAVFRDSSFANSPSKINVGEIFKMLAPDTRVKVI
ncbi:site-specific DNA-methyltransferase [Megasphaera sp. UPII 135-E]|uniref:site-specific DNA-methyltransferase n=1 Tax=Megasphaera sp. UPII 135-E TaxID=1000569 RepID=UPI00021A2480|nr:site-specific DNA-methyltransferase [Megasphaera sp. UPII 135-E]EGS36222.1 DNA (cytosine-5-)-methyltransferase [Megasphaera sp. UPII 135-E]